ncbi:hypothetical protein EG329_007556 [Mollisiaceae sp. DMI_Dod_QoI]|nr:hypothetical protein EG329_007556 [Helotiales sp. DMI_Dod_QoI]
MASSPPTDNGVITLANIARSNGAILVVEACNRIYDQRMQWINNSPEGHVLLIGFTEEILRRIDPESRVVIASKIEDLSLMLENETDETSAWHCPTGELGDRMEPGIADILASRVTETYDPIRRNYFTFAGAVASSLPACLLYERRETWARIKSHPLFIHFGDSARVKAKLVEFFNIRYTSLFADITGSHVTIDPAGITGSPFFLRLPDELPDFGPVIAEFAAVPALRGSKKKKQDERRRARLSWGEMTDEQCLRWAKGSEEQLFVLNAMTWGRLLFAADPGQQQLEEIAALCSVHVGACVGDEEDAEIEG